MSAARSRSLGRWSFIAWAFLGCATGTQDDEKLAPLGGSSGSPDMSTAGSSGSAGDSSTSGSGNSGNTEAGTSSTAGSNTETGGMSGVSGTFNAGGTTAGTFGSGVSGEGGASAGMSAGGAGAGAGGAAAGAGGKAAAGAAGQAQAGSSGSGGSAGQGGGGKCASGKLTPTVATASGTSEYAPAGAIDGDPKTRWASEQMVNGQYLQLDMGEPVTINRVTIEWEAAYATDYKIQIGNDAAGTFTDLYENKAGMAGVIDIAAPTLTVGHGRYLRVLGVTRKLAMYGISIIQIDVSGDKDETCQ